MKAFIFLLCTTVFSLTSENLFSQEKVTINKDQIVSVDKVFRIIQKQTKYAFIYPKNLFKNALKVNLKKGEIALDELLDLSVSQNNLDFKLKENNVIVIHEVDDVTVNLQKQISGVVTASDGIPLPGANVVIVGTNTGTQTDFDGKYSITASKGDVLAFSYVGFASQNIIIEDEDTINVTLQEDTSELEEVVVVGYTSVVKKKSTVSVATIDTEELQQIPSTTLGSAIAGRLAGVNITQTGGRPGRTSDITVRGATLGEFAGSSQPLYVIDGIATNKARFDALDVNEVETVTVLKDAAATAQYGARAANGVVLVTTKVGKGAPTINFITTYGTTKPTQVPETTHPFQHATLMNSALRWNNVDPSDAAYITPTELDYLSGISGDSFLDQLEKSPILQRYSLSVSGASDRVNYFLSGAIVKETAAFDNLTFDKANLRANIGIDVTDDLNVSMNLSTSQNDDKGFFWRWNGGDENYADFYRTAARSGKWGPGVQDGLFVANFNGWNAGNLIENGAGYQTRDNRITNALVKLDYKAPFLEGLSAGLSYNSTITRNDSFLFRKPLVDYFFDVDPNNRFVLLNTVASARVRNDSGADSDSVQEGTSETEAYQFNARINYSNTFGDHEVSAFAIYEQAESDFKTFGATGRNVPTELVPNLNSTGQDDERAFGLRTETARQSVIGGFSYGFKERYLLSGSFRYDGSVLFAPGKRFGFFPSISAAWIASDENFFKDNLDFIDFFKVRYSVGQVGNDNVGSGAFPYIQRYGIGTGAVFGNTISPSTVIGAEPSPLVTWEEQTNFNFGLDIRTLNNKLSTTIDIFKNKKRGLFGSRQEFIPLSSGLTLGPENYGSIDIKGFEVLTKYNTQIGNDFNVEAGFNVGYAKAEYVGIDEPESRADRFRRLGRNPGRFTGDNFTYIAEGIIRTQDQLDELLDAGFTQFGRAPRLGELLYRDVRGPLATDPDQNTPDGIIDGNDQTFIHDQIAPPVNFGITLNLRYKNFTLNAFAQGFAGGYKMTPDFGRFTISGIGESSWVGWVDSWTPENPNASFPVFGGDEGWRYRASTFWLRKSDFLRVKNLNLGYDLPKSAMDKLGVKGINIFVNATNLFFIYRTIKDFDPEINGQGIPVNRTYSLGININI